MTIDYTKKTNMEDLYNLCNKLELKNVLVIRKGELKKTLKNTKIKNIIINLDDLGNGTHWVFYSPLHKVYFDSYAQLAPNEIPKNTKLASTKKQLQSIESTDCGALCCLFAYYLNNKSKEQFYSLFQDVYPAP